jgi:hypothetical protein
MKKPATILAPASALLLAAAVATLWPSNAAADVQRTGEWPVGTSAEPKVDIDATGTPQIVLQRLAEKAHWNLVISGIPSSAAPVSIHAKGAAPADLLDAVLADSALKLEASRKGTLVRIAAANEGDAARLAGAPPSPGAIPSAPLASSTAPAVTTAVATAVASATSPVSTLSDKSIAGGEGRVDANERIRNLSVMGGAAEVFGIVEGDLAVAGGSVTLHRGAEVKGRTTVLGGQVDVEEGAQLLGEAVVMGGSIEGDGYHSHSKAELQAPLRSRWTSMADRIRSVFSTFTTFFLIGAILIALAPARAEKLRSEIAARPMRNVAIGVLGLLGSVLALTVLCVTVIGIPFALVLAMLGGCLLLGSMTTVFATGGERLLRKKTQNPYAHLALGAGLFAIVQAIPVVDGLAVTAITFLSVGALVTTRIAGYIRTNKVSVDNAETIYSTGQAYR